jgi:hypothetical protein
MKNKKNKDKNKNKKYVNEGKIYTYKKNPPSSNAMKFQS